MDSFTVHVKFADNRPSVTVDVKAESDAEAFSLALEKYVDAKSLGLFDLTSGKSLWKNL
jgi:hypothetical protein